MKQAVLIIVFLVALPVLSFAQYDSIVNAFQNEFDQFKLSATQEYEGFISHNDSVFIKFLQDSWEEVEVFQTDSVEEPKPVVQPTITADTTFQQLDYLESKSGLIPVEENNEELPVNELKPVNFNSGIAESTFDFYGVQEKVYYPPNVKSETFVINGESIAEFYTSLVKGNSYWDYSLSILNEAKNKYKLNDWGYYQLLKSAAKNIYTDSNEQRLLTWYLLLKSGYDTKVGYNDNDVFLLINSAHKLYGVTYLEMSMQKYYIPEVLKNDLGNLKVYKGIYPGSNSPYSFELTHNPEFKGSQETRVVHFNNEEVQFTFDKGVLDFMATYPLCELKTYFDCSVSKGNIAILDEVLNPMLDGKKDVEKVNVLLDFCQHAFAYETDQEQFGKEKYLFAEESLYYPYCDCEDRTILLASLVKRYTDLSYVALDYPGHVALAVNFNDDITGDYYLIDNKKYLVCDPTYFGAKAGMLHSDYKTLKPEVVTF